MKGVSFTQKDKILTVSERETSSILSQTIITKFQIFLYPNDTDKHQMWAFYNLLL